MKYLYHIVPDEVFGQEIVPLNNMKTTQPDLYIKNLAKYQGRENVIKQWIPILECFWNDVVFLSAVHPAEIAKAYASVGATLRKKRFYQIDPTTLDHSKMAVRLYKTDQDTKNEFVYFKMVDLEKFSLVPKRTLQYYRDQLAKKEPILIFVYIPHILLKGNLDLSKAKIIEV